MVHLKVILIIAITMAVSITTLTMKTITPQEEANAEFHEKNIVPMPSKIRRSRFLAENLVTERHPSAADHCHKENEMCYLVDNGKNKNATCCNNKCVDLGYDDKNCGACKKKCKFTQTCCRGECVELAYDKRHCGFCNHRCNPGEYCVYGMCNYA